MSTLALLQTLKDSILSQASVEAVYGEPVSAHGKTVIPVAKVMYGYGAGAGTGGVGDTSARGEGGGGGGGVRAIPVGVVEINEQTTSLCADHGQQASVRRTDCRHNPRYLAGTPLAAFLIPRRQITYASDHLRVRPSTRQTI
jgi:Sporulation protein YtfJ (Spore_YtfJ)